MLTIDGREFLSPADAAEHSGVALITIWRWLRVGVRGQTLPSVHVGGRRYIAVDELESFTRPVPVPRRASKHESTSQGRRSGGRRVRR